jgi:AcrR family transcriptional regulator
MEPQQEESALSKGERTQTALVEAAFTAFTKQGYHGTSMRTIAQEAGVAVGGIYNHFASKDAIFEAVVLAYHPAQRVLPKMIEAEGETAADRLRSAFQLVVEDLEQNPHIFNLLVIELIECQGRHLPALIGKLMPSLLGFMERLKATDRTLRPLPPRVLAQFFIGSLVSYWFTSRMLEQAGLPRTALADADQFIDCFLYGVSLSSVDARN